MKKRQIGDYKSPFLVWREIVSPKKEKGDTLKLIIAVVIIYIFAIICSLIICKLLYGRIC